MNIRIVYRIGIKRGFEAKFEHTWLKARKLNETFQGHVKEELLRSLKNQNEYVILTEWETEQHFEHWLQSSVHNTIIESFKELRKVPAKVDRFEIINRSANKG